MALYYFKPYLWGAITKLVNGDVLTYSNLYREGLERLGDAAAAIRDAYYTLRQDLASTAASTPALMRSTAQLGDLLYYDVLMVPTGDLDGKTLILTSNAGGPVTITFAQPGSPAEVASFITANAGATSIVATIDDGWDPATNSYLSGNVGKLRLTKTGGGTATITIGNGTANAILGFTNGQSVTGSGDVQDGTSYIGVGPLGTFLGGSLRELLELLGTVIGNLSTTVDGLVSAVNGKVDKAGDTLTGKLAFSGAATLRYRTPLFLSDADADLTTQRDVYVTNAAWSADRTLTLRTTGTGAPVGGERIRIIVRPQSGGHTLTLRQEGGSDLCDVLITTTDYTVIEVLYDPTAGSGSGAWALASTRPTPMTLLTPYPTL